MAGRCVAAALHGNSAQRRLGGLDVFAEFLHLEVGADAVFYQADRRPNQGSQLHHADQPGELCRVLDVAERGSSKVWRANYKAGR